MHVGYHRGDDVYHHITPTFCRETDCSAAVWFLMCFRSEDGSVYRLLQPGTWHMYGF